VILPHRSRLASTLSWSTLSWSTLALLIAVYAVLAGGLALRRHQNLDSQALDMGYADQVTWNALQGNGLRFTVFRGDVGTESGQPLRFGPGGDRDSLFAYHVELLFFPLALLYRVHAGPETLIVLLTAVIALGAVPAYLIARHQLDHHGAALAFGATYLLTPSVQAANLADFHGVSMCATLLMAAWYGLLRRRTFLFALFAGLAVVAKEEVGLLVGSMGLYAWLVQGRPRFGLATALLAFGWVMVCLLVVIPQFTGGAPSLFVVRYADAIQRLRSFPDLLLAGKPALPWPDYTMRYLLGLLAGTGFLALFGPLALLTAAPVLAINGLSGSTWQHGGGAHYSAEVVPALLVGAIGGTRWLAGVARRYWPRRSRHVVLLIAGVGLAGAAVQTWRHGILPPATRFNWPAPSPHAARVQPLLERIPPDAVVAAQSNLFPHLSRRPRIYVFPAVEDAEYVVADVAGTSDPLYPDALFSELNVLRASPRFELLAADDGVLLFRRHDRAPGAGGRALPLPSSFFDFARPAPGERYTPVRATMGDLFDVVGYRLDPLLEVNFAVRRVRPTLYVRARQPVLPAYRFTPFVSGKDGVARIFDEGSPTQLWYPTYLWRPGEVMRLPFPPITYGPTDRLGIGVQLGVDAVVPRLEVTAADRPVVDAGRVLLLAALP
jgi:uncharacterized membrane protein